MVSTLGEAWSAGRRIRVRWAGSKRDGREPSAGAFTVANSTTLLWPRGRNMPLTALAERLKCPRCSSRTLWMVFEPPGNTSRAGQ